jgi:hypothetical protein
MMKDLIGNPQLAVRWDADDVVGEMFQAGWAVRVVNTLDEANKLRAMIRGASRRRAIGGVTTYVTKVPAPLFEESYLHIRDYYAISNEEAPECDGHIRYLVEANTLDWDGGWGYPATRGLFHEMVDSMCEIAGMSPR